MGFCVDTTSQYEGIPREGDDEQDSKTQIHEDVDEGLGEDDAEISGLALGRLIAALASVSFLVNCQPSEPYLYQYLTRDKHLTEDQLNSSVWPYDTYGSFALLPFIGVAAESVGYRTVIFVGLLCRQATRLILLYAHGLWPMSVMQLTYAAANGTMVVYFSYAFLAVSAKRAPLAVSCMYAAYHAGNFVGSMMAEVLVSEYSIELHTLFYLSWVFSSAGLVSFLLFFPPPITTPPPSFLGLSREYGVKGVVSIVRNLYRKEVVKLWSGLWMGVVGVQMVLGDYYQDKLNVAAKGQHLGYYEAAIEGVTAVAVMLPSLFPEAILRHSWKVVIVSYLLIPGLVVVGGHVTKLAPVLITTIAILAGAFALQTAASVAITRRLEGERYALVFSLNSFVGLALVTIVTQVLSHMNAPTAAYYYYTAALVGVTAVVSMVIAFAAGPSYSPCSSVVL